MGAMAFHSGKPSSVRSRPECQICDRGTSARNSSVAAATEDSVRSAMVTMNCAIRGDSAVFQDFR